MTPPQSGERLPSVKQMANRSNSGHRTLLRAYADSKEIPFSASLTMGTLRGYRICLDTLLRWECIEYGNITERGCELLAALDAKEHTS